MSSGSYFPPPVRAVEIPKPHGGGTRILGVPTVADRVAQTVVARHLEGKVEPIFHPDSYGYRPGRSALDAVGACRQRCWKYDWVIDIDIRAFFDTVPWDLVVKAVQVHTDTLWVLLYVKRWLAAPLQQPDGTLTARHRGTPQGSALTPPTHWATFRMFTLRVGVAGVLSVAGDAFAQRDAVPDGDLLGSDEDVLDEQLEHATAFGDGGRLGLGVQMGEEAVQVCGEGEVGLAVGELGIQRLDLVAQVGLPRAQVGQAGAQLVDGDQLFAKRFDHPGDGVAGGGQRGVQPLPLADGGVAAAGGVEAFVDLGADQLGIGEQGGDVVPDHGVEVVGADGLVGGDPAGVVAVVVAAQAAVVVDLLVGGAGGGAVVAVTAGRAGGHTLQQRGVAAVAGGEALVVGQALGDPGEGVLADDGRHRDLGPLGVRPVDGLGRAWGGAALQPGDPVQVRGFVRNHRLAEHRAPGVGGVAQHAPDHAAVPAVLAGAGGHARVGQPAGQLGDRGAVVGVAAEQLADQRGLVLDDLVGGAGVRVLGDVAVAERGAGEHVERPGLGAVGLAAPVAFQDLRLLVLGEHALELHQQLIFWCVAARALDELHPGARAGEFLDQQGLVGELAGQPVRRVAQHHVDPDPGDQVAQPLQRGPHQGGAGVALVFEHPLLGDVKPQLLGVRA